MGGLQYSGFSVFIISANVPLALSVKTYLGLWVKSKENPFVPTDSLLFVGVNLCYSGDNQ